MWKSRSAGCQPPTSAFSMNCWMKVMVCSPLSRWWVGCRYSRILGGGLEDHLLGFWPACEYSRKYDATRPALLSGPSVPYAPPDDSHPGYPSLHDLAGYCL